MRRAAYMESNCIAAVKVSKVRAMFSITIAMAAVVSKDQATHKEEDCQRILGLKPQQLLNLSHSKSCRRSKRPTLRMKMKNTVTNKM